MKKYNAWCSCGWHGTYRTEGLAEFGRSKHSCEHWRAKRAKARRHADRMRAVDRIPKACTHPKAQHQHGTNAAYTLDKCRCWDCTAACSEYNTRLKRETAYGKARLVDAEPVREHVRSLMAASMGLKTVAARSGVAHGALSKLIYGTPLPDGTRRPPSVKLRQASAEALLAIRPDVAALAGGAVVDATGARRRIQALCAIGWSVQKVSQRSGIDRQAIDKIMRGAATSARTVRAIREAYDGLWDEAPAESTHYEKCAVSRTRNHARAAGWAPPMAWDDETIDDPEATPSTGEFERHRVDLDEWAHLVRSGESPARAAARIGTSLATAERTAFRNGRSDVLALMRQAKEVAA